MSARYIKGKESIIYILHENNWYPISCETSNSFTENVTMKGTTTRDNEGWRSSLPTEQGYTFEISGQAVFQSTNNVLSYFLLRQKKRNKELIYWRREFMRGAYIETGKGYITNISDESPTTGLVTFNLSLEGYLKPVFVENPAFVLSDFDDDILTNKQNEGLETK